jgi:hypothetical protein
MNECNYKLTFSNTLFGISNNGVCLADELLVFAVIWLIGNSVNRRSIVQVWSFGLK